MNLAKVSQMNCDKVLHFSDQSEFCFESFYSICGLLWSQNSKLPFLFKNQRNPSFLGISILSKMAKTAKFFAIIVRLRR